MAWIPDNYDRWKRYDEQQEAELEKLYRCSECDQPIQEEAAYYINGEWICDRCMEDNHRRILPY